MRKLTKKSKAVVAGLALVGVAGTGTAAYAYWSTTGTGTGTAATSAGSTGVTVGGTTALTAMYPGDSAQTFTATVTNTDTKQKAYVTSVKAYLTVAQASGATGSCSSADYLLDNTASTSATNLVTLGWTAQEIAANGTANTSGVDKIQFNDTSANQDGCKSATVTINYIAA